MRLTRAIWAFFCVLVIVGALVLAGMPRAHASGDRITQSNDMNNQTAGNIAGDSSRAYALGIPGMGDVDINQCLGSEQWTLLIGGRQKLVINWPCMAEFYLRNGAPELAAMALCNTEILDEFSSEAECEQAHQFLAMIEPAAAPPPMLNEHFEEEEEYHQEQQQLVLTLQQKVEELESRKPEIRYMTNPDLEAELQAAAERRARAREALEATDET